MVGSTLPCPARLAELRRRMNGERRMFYALALALCCGCKRVELIATAASWRPAPLRHSTLAAVKLLETNRTFPFRLPPSLPFPSLAFPSLPVGIIAPNEA